VVSIVHSNYDATENRAPGARIVIAALATAVALSGVRVAVVRLRGRGGGPSAPAGLLLSAAYFVLVLLDAIVTLASGPT
jgi:hypothetical protein